MRLTPRPFKTDYQLHFSASCQDISSNTETP